MANIYGIDLGTCNIKIFSKHSNKIIKEKNTIAVINKNQLYAYGDEAYAMYEKAPENINVSFPVTGGVIADYNNMQTMVQELLEKNVKGHVKGSEFIIAVPTESNRSPSSIPLLSNIASISCSFRSCRIFSIK